MGDLLPFVVVVVVAGVLGIRIGMLLAPRLGRIAGPDDEDEGGEDD